MAGIINGNGNPCRSGKDMAERGFSEREERLLQQFAERLQLRFDSVLRSWNLIRSQCPSSGIISNDKVSTRSLWLASRTPPNRHACMLVPYALACPQPWRH